MTTRRDLSKARRAIARGRSDEALVVLWNLLEPARIEGDRHALRAIGDLAAVVADRDESSRREAERLLEALGRLAPAAERRAAVEPAVEPIGPPPADEVEVELPPVSYEPPPATEPAAQAPGAEPGEVDVEDEAEAGRRPGLARYVVPLAALLLILVNVLARILRED